ncbi:MAG: DUF305 domain-containing protein [Gemmatimonadaceae bacterium]
MRTRFPTIAAALAVASFVACGVAAATPIHAQSTGSTAGRSAAPASARPKDHVPADLAFMQGMIGHHEQALVMAAMAPTHGASKRIQLFAKKIDLSQRDEIAFVKRWLGDRRLPLPAAHDHTMMHMPGMLTAEQMTQLDKARGARFDRLFLTFMIRHHEGALTMVQEMFAAPGGGQEPELYRFASDVDADQRTEIERMQQMLNTPTTPRSPSR